MKKYSSNKDWNIFIRQLVKRGWRYRRGGKHGRLTHPSFNRTLIVPTSPSDRRSLQNFIHFLRSLHKHTGKEMS